MSGKRIFVTPFRDGELLPVTVKMTDVFAECRYCQARIDLAILEEHENTW